MVYVSHFFCISTYLVDGNYQNYSHPYGENSEPCVGICGHSMCLSCINEDPNRMCAMCREKGQFVRREPNYKLIEMLGYYRENYWEMFKKCWQSENANQGDCSKCGQQARLRICLTCDNCSEEQCNRPLNSIRLMLSNANDLVMLSGRAVCANCASEFHEGHKTVGIHKIKFGTDDMRIRTATTILEVFGKQSKDNKDIAGCILRKWRLDSREHSLCTWLGSSTDPSQFLRYEMYRNEKCGHLGWQIITAIIEKHIEDIDLVNSELADHKNIKCECTQLYEKLIQSKTTTNYNIILYNMWLRFFNIPGCPLSHWSNKNARLELYSIINEIPEAEVTRPSLEVIKCPLCIFANPHYQDGSIHQHDWLSLVEDFWQSGIPSLKTYCFKCLLLLSQTGIGNPCGKCREIEKERGLTCFFIEFPKTKSNDVGMECIMNEKRYWKYNIIFAIRDIIRNFMIDRVKKASFHCELQKIRMLCTIHWFHYQLDGIDLRECTEEELLTRIARVEKYLMSLRFQWDTNTVESEKQPTNCMCSAPMKHLNKAVNYFWKTKHEKLESYNKLRLEFGFTADELLTEKIKGCPLYFGVHRFSNFTSIKQFYSEFVSVFCADDKLLMDSFYIGPHLGEEDFSDALKRLFVE